MERSAKLRRLLGQILAGALALRGFACSYPRRYVVPIDPGGRSDKDIPSDECQKLCAPLLGQPSGCSDAIEINGCELAWSPAVPPAADGGVVEPGGRGDEPEKPVVVCDMQMAPVRCGAGRRPSGLLATGMNASGGPAGAHLAALARLEAASVTAFLELRGELAAHDAPARLVAAAAGAAVEEARHARVTAELARRYGSVPRSPLASPSGVRSLEEVAATNAAEGCVRETFGALVAHFQARAARDPAVAQAMAVIAAEETAHAELAWSVHTWLLPLLTPEARRRVFDALDAAVDEILFEAPLEPDPSLTSLLGVPGAEEAAYLAGELAARLWRGERTGHRA